MQLTAIAKLQAIASAVERYGYCALTRSDLDTLQAAVAAMGRDRPEWQASTGPVSIRINMDHITP